MAGKLSLLVVCCLFAAAHSQSGDTGATGPMGYQGARGPPGSPGRNGATGVRGPSGPSGPSGPVGERGPPGNGAGEQGATGARGEMGYAGNRGAPGPRGPAGPAGRDAAEINRAEFERLLEDHNVDSGESREDEDDDTDFFKEHAKGLITGLFIWAALLTVAFFFYAVYQARNRPLKGDVLMKYSEIISKQNAENNRYDNLAYVENGKTKIVN